MANKDGSYPIDVTEEEWAFCAPYLTLMRGGCFTRSAEGVQRFAVVRAGGLPLADAPQ